MYPKTINNLIECFKKLPGVGEKSAERMALSCLNLDDETIKLFKTSLENSKTKIKNCQRCGNLSEEIECPICQNQNRDKTTICVVEESKNIVLFEKIGSFNGLYHVLGGLISPLDGINPEDINIDSLISRIEKEDIKEIIIAVKPTIEGETTALYIRKMLEGKDIKITKIAHGIPMGADIDYIDPLTLEIALEGRSQIS